ncbi:MAG: hypothetical protein C4520_00180 [Candidatus Abyssobacteria bacterium SURF_5]|uniref:Uncharacterized protein n=1 Tax=Abyssobacteria bacterium (strain SURF_5) TaxID=2093360 RepID=A0A3A4P232_ABYX5|nr:MAG: hypothetical protein C4520_00180 [Candidatus Abyssubacteria bacterium SURF_5]
MVSTEFLALQNQTAAQLFHTCLIAYIDPGTGSYLFQLLIAALLGAGFAVRTIRRRILDLLLAIGRSRKPPIEASAEPDEPSPTPRQNELSE